MSAAGQKPSMVNPSWCNYISKQQPILIPLSGSLVT